jgi:hypothetical protein
VHLTDAQQLVVRIKRWGSLRLRQDNTPTLTTNCPDHMHYFLAHHMSTDRQTGRLLAVLAHMCWEGKQALQSAPRSTVLTAAMWG